MSERIVIDDVVFANNCKLIRSEWKANRQAWNNADALCLIQGHIDTEVLSYSKSNISQVYLFGIEFPETAVFFTEKGIYIVTSENKAKNYLSPMIDNVIGKNSLDCEIKIFTRKRNASNDGIYDELKVLFASSYSAARLGLFLKEKANLQGKFITEFFEGMKSATTEEVDIALGFGAVLAVKNANEQEKLTRAGITCRRLMKNVFLPELEDISKTDRRVKHSRLADKLESALSNPEKYNLKYESSSLDICHQPIIQSGGKYNLRPSASSDDNVLKQDIVICSLGIRYDNYCASLARTFFINPSIFQQKCYTILADIESEVIKRLVPGAVLGRVYDIALGLLNERDSSLINYFTKECGVGIGLEFRESALRIKSGNMETVKAGMCFNIRLGFENVPNVVKETETNVNDLKTFSIMLADTIIIGEPSDKPVHGLGSSNHLLTSFSSEWSHVSFDLDVEEKDEKEETAMKLLEGTGRRVTRGMVRAEKHQIEQIEAQSTLLRRAKHQEKLRQELYQRKMKEASGIVEEDVKEVVAKDIDAFNSPSGYPTDVKLDQIYVDTDNEVIFVPIHGVPVPFSVQTVKSVSMTEEGGYGYFRLNFHTPQGKGAKDLNPSMVKAFQDYPAATYIRNLTFRSRDQSNMNIQVKRMKNLLKQRKQQDKFDEESADIVAQGDIQLLPRNAPHISDVDMRPALGKTKGRLEAHVNGFRYSTRRGEKVDILYANIKHAIFQPCDQTRFVILHFHLHNPIMIGRKKVKDIQFYTEVIDASKNLKGISTNAYDPEEIQEEQRERETIRRLNEIFRKFTQQCDKIEFDMPYLKSSFLGRPHKEMVMLSPCRDCLFNITEQPSLIVTLDEIERVHFQRVTFTTTTADMIIIFKDYKKPVVEIDAIKVTDMDKIKEWIDSIDLTFSESAACFDWKELLESARTDPYFWKDVDEEGNGKPVGWDIVSDEYIQQQMGAKEEEEDNFSDDIHTSDLEEEDDDDESMDEEEEYDDVEMEEEEDFSDAISLSDM